MRNKAFILITAAFLAGCSFRPDMPNVDTNFTSTYTFETSDIRDLWWKEFHDENLNSLVESALEKNTDLRIAYLNLEKAKASLGVAEADLLPGVNLNAGATRTRNSAETATHLPQTTTKSYEINLGLSYEIDLWGRVRNSVLAANESLNASKFDYDSARLSLSSSVAKSYFALVSLNMQEAVLKETLKTYEDTLALRKTQLDLGSINEMTYLQSKAEVERAKTSLTSVLNSKSQALTSLAILTGKSNDEILKGAVASAQNLPSSPEINAGISSDVLLRRSDVAKALADLKSTNALVGVARAQYFPTISLTGLFGFASDEFDRIFMGSASVWSLGANLTRKIFDFGKTKNNVRVAETNEQIAAITYEATVRSALGEVRDALISRQNAKLSLDQVKNLLQSQQKIYSLAKDQYNAGYIGHLELLDAERNLLSAKLQDVSAKLDEVDSAVEVYRALGGGFKVDK
ncbi:NodT family efflux transporter, outer membrane factor (OMF) lipoprotein [Campylobacter sp. 10_1_50]|uniref:efflux transporter outer membrane subunit n=1 Tax=Campylobacter TaxID=194 RepID=UPI000240FF72|nr:MULTISPECIES: efflux transporter outer membrane subunit [Campylobacter]EHL89200.1 NodT family efflux transporter, outer membrane factor (OMF) lipoprotein [Campylobacter sp. 10_1_50]